MREIAISIGETKFIALLLEKEAPETCKAYWDVLPIESDFHHAKIAGNEVFCSFFKPELKLPEKLENRKLVAELKAGDIFGYEIGLGVIYGEVAPEPYPVTVFARVTEKRELEKMKKACRSVWRKNGQKMAVRKKA